MRKSILSIITASILAVCSSANAGAAVIITFQESGNNVVASTSGSFFVPPTGGTLVNQTQTAGNTFLLIGLTGTVQVYFNSGISYASGLSAQPNFHTGTSFAYSVSSFTVPTSAVGTYYSPTTTWTWTNQSISSIGLGALTSTPSLVFQGAGDTISFARAVPEPSTYAAFAGLAVLGGAIILRRRKVT